jgi:heat shock protein HslJ
MALNKLRNALASLAALVLTAGIATAGVATDEPTDEEMVGVFSIEGMTWLLTAQQVDGEMVPVPERLNVSLYMDGGEAGGNGGCNGYFTSYEMDGFDVTFGQIGSTMMACVPPIMEIEHAYFANLGQVAAYQSGGIQMALLDAEGDFLLEFDLAPEASVVGSWVAQGINNGSGGVETTEYTSTVTAVFDESGQLSGVDGCNNYFTTYEVDGDSITIAPEIGTTLMACADPAIDELSQQYYAALVASTTWSVDASGSLELRDDGGSLQVRYLPTE